MPDNRSRVRRLHQHIGPADAGEPCPYCGAPWRAQTRRPDASAALNELRQMLDGIAERRRPTDPETLRGPIAVDDPETTNNNESNDGGSTASW